MKLINSSLLIAAFCFSSIAHSDQFYLVQPGMPSLNSLMNAAMAPYNVNSNNNKQNSPVINNHLCELAECITLFSSAAWP